MNMHRLSGTLLTLVLGTAAGCGDGHDHDEKAEHGSGGSPAAVPEQYGDAVAKCEELSNAIGKLIAAGKLSDVHAAAAEIQKIAEKLPELARKSMPAEMLKDVNVKSKELAGTFSEIDEAADAGKKDETVKVHEKIQALIAALKRHAGHP